MIASSLRQPLVPIRSQPDKSPHPYHLTENLSIKWFERWMWDHLILLGHSLARGATYTQEQRNLFFFWKSKYFIYFLTNNRLPCSGYFPLLTTRGHCRGVSQYWRRRKNRSAVLNKYGLWPNSFTTWCTIKCIHHFLVLFKSTIPK